MTDRKLRVLFDSEVFSLQAHGGASRYYAELMRKLPDEGVTPLLVAPISFNHHLGQMRPPGLWGMTAPRRFQNRVTSSAVRHLSAACDRLMSQAVQVDFIHQTYFCRRYPYAQRVACTVLDMVPEIFPMQFPGGGLHSEKATTVRSASLVFTISEKTKEDLLRFVPEITASVHAVPLAVDREFFSNRARDATAEVGQYILFVGRRPGYKNFARFALAVVRVLIKNPMLRLLCVGGGPLRQEEIQPFVEAGVADRIVQRFVPDEELPRVYREAVLFVFPSLYEGFGLPILEAFASSCPVALSRASCFPEVADEAGLYFDPEDTESIQEVLQRATSDSRLRQELRERGTRRLQCFSWERSARATASAYRQAIESRP